jgi:hypothetical protein
MSRLETLKKQIILDANVRLSEQALPSNKSVVTPANKAAVTPATTNYESVYQAGMGTIWPIIRNAVAMAGNVAGSQKPTGIVQWTYPVGTTEPKVQLHKQDGQIADTSVLSAYDKLFNQKLNALSDDMGQMKILGDKAMAVNQNTDQNIKLQTHIMNTIIDKTLVKDNGTPGGAFNDGTFNSVTLRAGIKLKIQNNYSDSTWMLKHVPPLI